MQSYGTPGGIDYSEQRTTPPVGAPPATKPANSQFGVEQNQVGETMANLTEKAQADLRNKVGLQRTGGYDNGA